MKQASKIYPVLLIELALIVLEKINHFLHEIEPFY
jgi:hypothetical protein